MVLMLMFKSYEKRKLVFSHDEQTMANHSYFRLTCPPLNKIVIHMFLIIWTIPLRTDDELNDQLENWISIMLVPHEKNKINFDIDETKRIGGWGFTIKCL